MLYLFVLNAASLLWRFTEKRTMKLQSSSAPIADLTLISRRQKLHTLMHS
jgi:hypothetical protein